jgi:hypothetical protein
MAHNLDIGGLKTAAVSKESNKTTKVSLEEIRHIKRPRLEDYSFRSKVTGESE